MAISPEKEARLLEISKQTLEEVQTKLQSGFKRVLVVRPTGFGKSYMLAGLTTTRVNGELRYKKCLYIYPTDVIKEDVIRTYADAKKFAEMCEKYKWKNVSRKTDERAGMLNSNTDFLSYNWLTNRANDIKEGDMTKNKLREIIKSYDLIMLDECHRVGADGFQDAFEYFKSCISADTHLVGVTATPYRYDSISIKEVFGERNQISRYTLKDAIKENLLSRFDYIYTVSDNDQYVDSACEVISDLKLKGGNGKISYNEREEIEQCMHNNNVVGILKQTLKLPIVQGETEEHTGNNNYAKFVVFMNNRNHIHDYADTVASWFKEAYTTMNIRCHVIITKTKQDKPYTILGENVDIEDTDELSNIDIEDNVIDLIFCIDKLNMGYHVESITGVVLMGNTESATKYNQQIGRCFSIRSETKPIIIDVLSDFRDSPSVQKWQEFKKLDDNKGRKVLLPDLLDKSCVDSCDYTEAVTNLARKLVDQSFDKKDAICWTYTNRHMQAVDIAKSLGIKLDTVIRVLLNNKIELLDTEQILEHRELLSEEILKRLGA